MATELMIPDFFDATRCGEVFRIPYLERAERAKAWAQQHGISEAAGDGKRVCLLAIDVQNTFCIPGFELFVGGRSGTGAVDDSRRLCEFIYRNLSSITEIAPTLDTHTAAQIFHPAFWLDGEGNHPAPMTMIGLDEVVQGKWRVNPAIALGIGSDADRLQEFALHYVHRLSEDGKYPLTIWPYHSMLGGIGHALVSAFEEACFFHNRARQSQTRFELKGGNPLTENYSVLRPEVMDGADGRPIAGKNSALIDHLLGFDGVVVAGQAKSHCVAWTVEDLLMEIQARDPLLARKVYLLEDCTSSVVVPGVVDFTEQGDGAYARFAAAGMQVVQSTTPMADWPGLS
ncbi:MAG: isochorismatase [Synechococcales cyanobacterium RM1_1_8]|nr:isochorismatase [Synechococcales cyanobacterium RM1_1_8]